MFATLVGWMTDLIHFCYTVTNSLGLVSYGWAIILFTIVIKMVLYPLTVKQMRSLKMTQLLQPKVKEIQEKYKKDPQKSQQLMMELYKENGANPLSGCLPILVQMPIFIALFRALQRFKYTTAASSQFLWLDVYGKYDLSHKDPYFIIPLLAGAATFLQQKMSSTNVDDPTQRTMLYVMPVMFGYMASTMPAGLGIYWVVFSVMGILQQYFINRQTVVLKGDENKDESMRKKRKNS